MEFLFNLIKEYIYIIDMVINAKKSVYFTIFTNSYYKFQSNNELILICQNNQFYKYLGLYISLNLNWDKVYIEILTKFKNKVKTIILKFYLSTE
jgi:hypothetical protein